MLIPAMESSLMTLPFSIIIFLAAWVADTESISSIQISPIPISFWPSTLVVVILSTFRTFFCLFVTLSFKTSIRFSISIWGNVKAISSLVCSREGGVV